MFSQCMEKYNTVLPLAFCGKKRPRQGSANKGSAAPPGACGEF